MGLLDIANKIGNVDSPRTDNVQDKENKGFVQPTKVLPFNYIKKSIKSIGDSVITHEFKDGSRLPEVYSDSMGLNNIDYIENDEIGTMHVLMREYNWIFVDTVAKGTPDDYSGKILFPHDVVTASAIIKGLNTVNDIYLSQGEMVIFQRNNVNIVFINLGVDRSGREKPERILNCLVQRLHNCKPCVITKDYYYREDRLERFRGDVYYVRDDDDAVNALPVDCGMRTTVGTQAEDVVGPITYNKSDWKVEQHPIYNKFYVSPSFLVLKGNVYSKPLELEGLKSCEYMFTQAENFPKAVEVPSTVVNVSNMFYDPILRKPVDGVIKARSADKLLIEAPVKTIKELVDECVVQIDKAVINGMFYERECAFAGRFSYGTDIYSVDVNNLNCSSEDKERVIERIADYIIQDHKSPSTGVTKTSHEIVEPGEAFLAVQWRDSGD